MEAKKRNIVLIGATGSIGKNTLEVIRQHPEQFNLIGIAANRNENSIINIAKEFSIEHTALFSKDGIDGITELSTLPEADIVVMAATGTICLIPTLAALEANKTVALASKEVLVLGGKWVMEKVSSGKGKILPVDSEHNALLQCMAAFPNKKSIDKIILTASGGPFRNHSIKEMQEVTKADALNHPNWEMGSKITIDSATMANKGLEIIEAKWLFDLEPKQIEVVIHPQSIVHSMVQGIDGSVIAQLCPASMTFPIQNILSYPNRIQASSEPLTVQKLGALEFTPPNFEKFPCLKLAFEALLSGGIAPMIYNTANNVAVEAFIKEEIHFLDIPKLTEIALKSFTADFPNSIKALIQLESEITSFSKEILKKSFCQN